MFILDILRFTLLILLMNSKLIENRNKNHFLKEMTQHESSVIYDKLQNQIVELNEYAHNEITKIYNFLNQKILISIQSNAESIIEMNNRLDNVDGQHSRSPDFNNELCKIKHELKLLKNQVSETNSKTNLILETKVAENSEQITKMSKMIDLKSDVLLTNDIEFLKSEMKQLKDRLNSTDFINAQSRDAIVAPIAELKASQIKNEQSDNNLLQAENKKIKTDFRLFKSQIKKIISKALSDDNQIETTTTFTANTQIKTENVESNLKLADTKEKKDDENQIKKDNQISTIKSVEIKNNNDFNRLADKLLLENERMTNDINYLKFEIRSLKEERNNEEPETAQIVIPGDFVQQINDAKSQSLEAKTKTNELKQKVEQLKNDFNNLKTDFTNFSEKMKNDTNLSSIANEEIIEMKDCSKDSQYKVMEATFKANDAQSNAIEAINTSMAAECVANDASFKATEAEFKATSAIEKANRIISDNDKMHVDIRCLKYEVKKLRARVTELEQENSSESTDVELPDELIEQLDSFKSDIKHLKSQVKKLKASQCSGNNSTQMAITDSDSSSDKSDSNQNQSSKGSDSKSKINNSDSKILESQSENKALRNDLQALKSDIEKVKQLITSEDFVSKIKNAQMQSSRAYEKASKTHKDISEFELQLNEAITKAKEVNEKVEKLLFDNEQIKNDFYFMKIDLMKLKENFSDIELKVNKKDSKKRKNNV